MSTPPVIKRSIFLLLSFIVITVAKAQTNSETVSIPDPNFEQALIDLGIDSDRNINGSVFLNDVKNIEVLEVPNRNISSLEGLSAFSNLRILRAWENQISSLDVSVNILLVHLSVANNQITGLDLSANTALVEVYAYNNNLSDLQIAANNQLKHLSVSDNQLTELDLSGSSALVDVYINNNNLSVVNLGSHPYLSNFHAGGNQINAVDVTNLPALRSFLAWGSKLSEIDFTNNILLEEVDLNVNNLSSLDLSNNPNLNFVFCNSNNLKSLNISNGNNAGMVLPEWSEYTLDARGNPDLRCIQVDAEMVEANRTDWGKDTGAIYSSDCANKPEYISIPDPNFEQALIDLGVDSDGFLNTYLLLTDAESVTNLNLRLPVNFPYGGGNTMITNVNSSITDLTGIEAFVNLKELLVDSNDLESMDITGLSQLSLLYCSGNNLSQIDLSQNPELKYLRMNNNTLTQLDVSNNPALELLIINDNNLAQIDLSGNALLKDLQFLRNPISNLDILNLSELETLYCGKTNISSLDLSKNLKLKNLNIDELPISELDLSTYPHFERLWARNTSLEVIDFSKNSNLLQVWIENSPLKTLDLSNNAALFAVVLDNNLSLENLDLRNGNNLAMNFFRLNNTPNLTCVNADANISQAMIDSGKNFSEDCRNFIYIADANFEQSLIDLGIDSDGVINQSILRSDAEAVLDLNLTNPALVPENEERYANPEIVNVEGKIQDLTGIEAFVNLNNLRAFSHELTSIDVSSLKELRRLELVNNQIASIDVSKNTKLEIFWLESNNLNEVDLTNNTELVNIALGYNNLTEVNVTQNTKLWALTIEGNDLTTVDVSQNKVIAQIWVAENPNLTHMDFSQNTEMYGLGIYNTAIKTLDLSHNPMTRLYAGNNPNLEHLDLRNGNNLNLNQFWVDNTPNLSCINADETISQVMIDSGKSFSEDCGDFIYIADANFEQSLIDLGIDSDGVVNTSILREDAEAVTNLNLNNPLFDNSAFANPEIVNVEDKIADLTGIEAFVNLKSLQVAYGALTEIDLSKNFLLEELFLNDNQLNSIDVSMLSNLKRFGIMRNEMTSGIDVSANPLLEELFVHETGISAIDLTANPYLWNLYIQGNDLSALDLSANMALTQLRCQNNNISQLDISTLSLIERIDAQYNAGLVLATGANGNPTLTSLNLSGTGLSNFNGATYPNLEWLLLNDNALSNFNGNNNLLLQNLFLNNNAISKLSLTGNTALAQLKIENNGLEELDLRNDNNMDLQQVEATVNILTCISVDAPGDDAMPYSQWQLDLGVILSINCKQAEEVVIIPDPNFEQALIDAGYDTNGDGAITGNILLSEAEAVTILDVSGRDITDVTGIEALVNLTELNISGNLLTAINLQENKALTALDISGNMLNELFIGNGKVMTSLNAADNDLDELNFADLINLQDLDISGNQFQSLDFRGFNSLRMLDVSSNQLTSLDLRNGNNLIMNYMDASGNPLSCIGVDDISSIPEAWTKEDGTSYTATGDCEDPIVQTRDITISLDRNGLAVITAEDINDGSFDNMTDQKNLIFDLNIKQFSCENLGENEVSLFVTDASGNIGTATALVSVIDEIAPDVSAVRSISLDLNGASFVEVDPSALDNGSTDNCAGLDFSVDQSSFNFPGTYPVEFRVTDLSGNSSSAYVDVEVVDSASEPTSLKFKKNVVATVYPNPFSDKLRITFSTLIDLDSVEVSLYTLSPSLTGVQFEVEENEIVSTNADILPVGTYSLMITLNGETQSALVIKEN